MKIIIRDNDNVYVTAQASVTPTGEPVLQIVWGGNNIEIMASSTSAAEVEASRINSEVGGGTTEITIIDDL